MEVKYYENVDIGIPYVPDYLDNRSLPESEQIVVWIRPLSKSSQNKFGKKSRTRINRKTSEISSNALEIQRDIALKHIVKVVNCSIRDIATSELIEQPTVAQFYDMAPGALVDDVLEAIQDHSVLDDGKK